MRINDKNINRQIGAPWIGLCDAREIILFFSPPQKEKETQPMTKIKIKKFEKNLFLP